jgi:hypothetical protein
MIDLTQIHKYFFYENGKLFWKCKKAHTTHKIGDEAGSTNIRGYKSVCINRKHYRIHKIIWFIHHGDWPETIDHIDGNPSNNRIENLRKVSQAQNSMNRKIAKNNKSGITGVYFCSTWKRWKAEIKFNTKKLNLGSFNSFEDAANARLTAEKKYHGEFSRMFTGDLRGTSVSDLIASCQDGENSGVQAPCLAQGQRIGE